MSMLRINGSAAGRGQGEHFRQAAISPVYRAVATKKTAGTMAGGESVQNRLILGRVRSAESVGGDAVAS
jgi:hypothetical protein